MADSAGVEAARALLERAVQGRVFPAAVAEVGESAGTLWREAFGRLTFDPATARADARTIFDLASLTKPIATTTLVMQLVARGALALEDRVGEFFDGWRGADREGATIRDLLEHAAGLPARLLDAPPPTRREFEHEINSLPLEYPLRTASVYSDLGFILLGFVAEDRGKASLAKQFDQMKAGLKAGTTPETNRSMDSTHEIEPLIAFNIPAAVRERVAPTLPEPGDPRRGRRLVGEVHDDYAARLGGVAGHAGLFGDVAGVSAFARVMLRAARGDEKAPTPLSPEVVNRVTAKSTVPGSSRGLGWDTMLPTSSCGTELSPTAFGHVGFTGTSVWIDPILDRYFVLLTNRACGGGTLDQMRDIRRAFHDALAKI